jgi:phospholipid/cholesterol/gamma-HCH transport system substrate-binding protein
VTRVRHTERLPNWLVGLIVVAVIGFATILAFSGLLGLRMPWQGGYEIKAVFGSAQNIRQDSPVRIAGVNVGTVTGVEHLSGAESELTAQAGEDGVITDGEPSGQPAAVVTMDLTEEALPIKEDAEFKLRPRLFLEGNYFVDLQPGSPAADEVSEGHVFPVNQTSYSVQLDQVLTTLQSDVRRNLQIFLDQFGNALIEHGGAEGFREYFASSAAANKFTSQVNEALLGTEPGDLGGMIRGLDKVVRGLGRNEQTLQDLVTDFRIFSGSFAAEDVALGQAIERLPGVLQSADPAFANLNAAFPPLRAFAREALPGVRSTPETLRVATPFIVQVRKLVSRRELRGLVADLRPTIPRLADLAKESIPFMKEARALSSCFNEVIIPWSHDTVEPVDPTGIYPHDPPGRVFEETGYVLTGLTGIGRNGDANGQWGRVLGQSGPNIVDLPSIGQGPDRFAITPFPLLGSMPGQENSAKTKLTPRHRCERQEPPNLQATLGGAPQQQQLSQSSMTAVSPSDPASLERAAKRFGLVTDGESGGGS